LSTEYTFIEKMKSCCLGKKKKLNVKNYEDYSEGESDTEFETPYS